MRCPICRKPVDISPKNRFRPFCSERCQMVDLGTWAAGDYRVESSEAGDKEHPDDLPKKPRLIN